MAIIAGDPHLSFTAIHELLTVTQYLDVLSGRGDRAGVLDYLPHNKEANDVIRRAPSLVGGEVIC
jgi:hypothetical protein